MLHSMTTMQFLSHPDLLSFIVPCDTMYAEMYNGDWLVINNQQEDLLSHFE